MEEATVRGVSKDIRQLFRTVKKHGWTVERRKSGHYLLQGPNDEKVFCGGTPSDHRAVENIKRDLSRNGLDLS